MADADLKRRLESLLFSSGRKIEIEELSKHCKEEKLETIKEALQELQQELDDKESSLMLIEEGSSWKLTVREKYLPYVKKVVKQPELPKSFLETLAIVAFKAPALQSQIIKIRTNKAYKHLEELEKNGYITREKKGRTKLIKLTQKFFDYFDLPPDKLKEKFKNVTKLEHTIEQKEQEIEAAKTEYTTIERTDTPAPNPVEVVKEKVGNLEVYETTPKEGETPTLGKLEVYDIPEKKKKKIQSERSSEGHRKGENEKEEEKTEEELKQEKKAEQILEPTPEWAPEEKKEDIVEEPPRKETKPSKGIFPEGTPPEVEKKIDEIVKEMTAPKEEE